MRSVPVGIRLILAMALVSVILLLGALDACTVVPSSSGMSLAAGTTTGSSSGSGSGSGGAGACGPETATDAGPVCTPVAMCGCDGGTTCTPTGCGDWARWPMPNPPSTGLPNPSSYSADMDAGVVVDNVTKLTWQATFGDADTYQDAVMYCTSLGSIWRLPTRIELVSLLDYTQMPLIDPTSFPDTPLHAFWTSTLFGNNNMFFVNFGTGFLEYHPDGTSYYVRCVH